MWSLSFGRITCGIVPGRPRFREGLEDWTFAERSIWAPVPFTDHHRVVAKPFSNACFAAASNIAHSCQKVLSVRHR